MNLAKLSFSYIRQRKLNTLLNVLLLALGIATIVVLLLFSNQVEENLTRNAQGIDLVVGAKGSPLQLILSSIYHIDAPTGNIPMQEAQMIMQNRAVRQAIPLALGDSYSGYRIVGTTHAYPAHYGASVARGALWDEEMEVILGAQVAQETGLDVGGTFASAHGLSAGGQVHGGEPLRVVGVLAPSGSVLDRLILTSIETVWAVHEEHGGGGEHEADTTRGAAQDAEDEHAHAEAAPHDEEEGAPQAAVPPAGGALPFGGGMPGPQAGSLPGAPGGPDRELTAVLLQYSSPIAAAMFPRFVNSQTNLQAASPAFETARLLNLLGIGLDALQAFGIILILAAALGVFIALYNALKERQYDLAIMRTLGASRSKLLWHVLLEGLILALMGTLVGLALGHLAAEVLGGWAREAQQMDLTGWIWVASEFWLVVLALGVGLVAALLPALQAYRTDIAETLARG